MILKKNVGFLKKSPSIWKTKFKIIKEVHGIVKVHKFENFKIVNKTSNLKKSSHILENKTLKGKKEKQKKEKEKEQNKTKLVQKNLNDKEERNPK